MSNLNWKFPAAKNQLQNASPPTDQESLKIDIVTGAISLVDSLGVETPIGASAGNSNSIALIHEFTLAEINAWVGASVNVDFALARPAGTVLKAIYVLTETALFNGAIPNQSADISAAIKCFGANVTSNEHINGSALLTLNKVATTGTNFTGGNDALVGPDNLRVIITGELGGAPSVFVGGQFTAGKFKVFAKWAPIPNSTYLSGLV